MSDLKWFALLAVELTILFFVFWGAVSCSRMRPPPASVEEAKVCLPQPFGIELETLGRTYCSTHGSAKCCSATLDPCRDVDGYLGDVFVSACQPSADCSKPFEFYKAFCLPRGDRSKYNDAH